MVSANTRWRKPKNPTRGTIHHLNSHFSGIACALVLGAAFMVPCMGDSVQFTSPGASPFATNEGVVNLAWEAAEEAIVELQQSPDPAFPESETRTRYQGTDPGSVISGLPEGSHHFRIRAITADGIPSEWSAPLEVRVEFMATKWVVTLLVFGGVVFITTLAAIITGHLRTRQSHTES